MSMAHSELVARGSAWLRKQGCAVVFSELTAHTRTGELPDVIGWRGGNSVLIECKVSRSDFLADKNKSFRSEGGMGDFRLYLSPPDVIAPSDLPEGWGLLIARGSRIEIAGPLPRTYETKSYAAKGPRMRRCVAWWDAPFTGNKAAENAMLLSAIRRMQLHHGQPECDRLIHMTYADKEIAA